MSEYKEIKSFDDLLKIRTGNKYKLVCDIDCKKQPISKILGDFSGEIDGCGYSISNLILKESQVKYDAQPISLFYTMKRAEIKNLRFVDLKIDLPKTNYDMNVAGLCVNASDSIFKNISFDSLISNEKELPLIYDSNNCKYSNIKLPSNMVIAKYE